MKNETKDLFGKVASLDKEVSEQLINMLELPDEQFDAIYPMFKEKLADVYEGEEFQKKLLNQLAIIPIDNIGDEKQVLDEFLENIYEDDTLSANKKELIASMFNSTLDVLERLLNSRRQSVSVKIVKLNTEAIIPTYAHPTDAGADISAIEDVLINAGETKLIKTGLAVSIPAGYEIQLRPRSGLSLKTGLRIANAPATIDAFYLGEVGVIMTNTDTKPYQIEKGMRIAQMVIAPTPMINWKEVQNVEELGDSERGEKGFGSTGLK